MPKRQLYSFIFNEQQLDPYTAMSRVGSKVNSIKNVIAKNMLDGNITEEGDPSLSSDGLTLNVERIWSDAAYNELMSVTTIQEIIDHVNALDFVSVQNYEFIDV